MEDLIEFDCDITSKVSQTVIAMPTQNYSSMSLVNYRGYSPLPIERTKIKNFTPKKLRKIWRLGEKRTSNAKGFKLPGQAANFKELISPFSLRTKDYSNLYSNCPYVPQKFVHLPGIKPNKPKLKQFEPKRKFRFYENLASKKELVPFPSANRNSC